MVDADTQEALKWTSAAIYSGGGDTVSLSSLHLHAQTYFLCIYRRSQCSFHSSSSWRNALSNRDHEQDCDKEYVLQAGMTALETDPSLTEHGSGLEEIRARHLLEK